MAAARLTCGQARHQRLFPQITAKCEDLTRLTWCFYRLFTLVDDRFPAMFAPRLLVSPDLVVRAGQHARPGPYRWLYTA